MSLGRRKWIFMSWSVLAARAHTWTRSWLPCFAGVTTSISNPAPKSSRLVCKSAKPFCANFSDLHRLKPHSATLILHKEKQSRSRTCCTSLSVSDQHAVINCVERTAQTLPDSHGSSTTCIAIISRRACGRSSKHSRLPLMAFESVHGSRIGQQRTLDHS